ncbi:MAG TPA: DUF2793 domain-containing protein [Brevundimonas sp.]|jgi:hypothetical protein|uniref:DUF2793 domain-containing protein n=1 Tax=Brevundimonas sp. TaxID=1871086 RepID=UPI002DEFDA1C|nr:DUF2793 domain-containing protein [Brevundimonas sp.]
MSDDFSARLGLPFLAGGQLQKHVTLNAALSRLDALVHLAVHSRTISTQPEDAVDGDAWLLPSGATGSAWGLMAEGAVAAFQDGGWVRLDPPPGALVLISDEGSAVIRTEAGWAALGEVLGALDQLDGLGVGTAADDLNRLAARLNGALFTALTVGDGGTGDVRLSVNREADGDVASVVFQSAYSGRAEIGLVGDDRLSLKVSADGMTWHEALGVDPSDGRVAFPLGAGRHETTVLTTSGTYLPPAWAREIRAVAIGGGGGGGGGQGGPASTLRMGGGGGGAGGQADGTWPAAALAGSLSVTVGAGGEGGAAGLAGGHGGQSSVMVAGAVVLRAFGGGGGSADGVGGDGGLAVRPANGGGPSYPSAPASNGISSVNWEGPGGGAGGGAVGASNVAQPGGGGGTGAVMSVNASGGDGGAGAAGTPGADAPAPDLCRAGGGGGGGGGEAAATGRAGGSGGLWGGGGGGGGGGLSTGGTGGAGAAGVVVITAVG